LGVFGILLQSALLLVNLLGVGISLSELQRSPALKGMGENRVASVVGMGVNVLTSLVVSTVSGIILLGGIRMNGLRSWGISLASAILAMLPCLSPCCCLGLPFGIWAVVVLADDEVRSCFR